MISIKTGVGGGPLYHSKWWLCFWISFRRSGGWVLLGLRPLDWKFYTVKVSTGARRIYIGPIEIEVLA